ncbi:MAG: hypothetical protein Q9163_002976 [Psora crenata]
MAARLIFKRVFACIAPVSVFVMTAKYNEWMDNSTLCNIVKDPSCLSLNAKLPIPRIHFTRAHVNDTVDHYPETEVSVTIKHNGSVPPFWSDSDSKGTFIIQDHRKRLDFWSSESARMPIVVEPWTPPQEPSSPLLEPDDNNSNSECASIACNALHFVYEFRSTLWGLCSSLIFDLLFRYLQLSSLWMRIARWIYYPKRRRSVPEKQVQQRPTDPVPTPDPLSEAVLRGLMTRIRELERREGLMQSLLGKQMISRRQEYVRAVVLQNWKIRFLNRQRAADKGHIASLETRNRQVEQLDPGRMDRVVTALRSDLNDSTAMMAAVTKREAGLKKRLSDSRKKMGKHKAAKDRALENFKEMKTMADAAEKRVSSLIRQKAKAEDLTKGLEQIADDANRQIRKLNDAASQQSSKTDRLEGLVSTVEVAKRQLQRDNDALRARLAAEEKRATEQLTKVRKDMDNAKSAVEAAKRQLQRDNIALRAQLSMEERRSAEQLSKAKNGMEASESSAEAAAKRKLQHDNEALRAQLTLERRQSKRAAEQAARDIAQQTALAAEVQARLDKQAAEYDELQQNWDITLDELKAAKRKNRGNRAKKRADSGPAVAAEDEVVAVDAEGDGDGEDDGEGDTAAEELPLAPLPSPSPPEAQSVLSLPPVGATFSSFTFSSREEQPLPLGPDQGAQSTLPLEHLFDQAADVRLSLPRSSLNAHAATPPRTKTRRGSRGVKKTMRPPPSIRRRAAALMADAQGLAATVSTPAAVEEQARPPHQRVVALRGAQDLPARPPLQHAHHTDRGSTPGETTQGSASGGGRGATGMIIGDKPVPWLATRR